MFSQYINHIQIIIVIENNIFYNKYYNYLFIYGA